MRLKQQFYSNRKICACSAYRTFSPPLMFYTFIALRISHGRFKSAFLTKNKYIKKSSSMTKWKLIGETVHIRTAALCLYWWDGGDELCSQFFFTWFNCYYSVKNWFHFDIEEGFILVKNANLYLPLLIYESNKRVKYPGGWILVKVCTC